MESYILEQHVEANDPSVEGGLKICSKLNFR